MLASVENVTGDVTCAPQPYRLWWPVLVLLVVPGGGIYANSAVCLSLWYKKKRLLQKTPVYTYLLSQAVSDTFNCVLLLPMSAVKAFLGTFPGSVLLCRVWFAADLLLTSATVLHLCLMCIQLAVSLSSGRQCRGTCHTATMLSVVWLTASIITVCEMTIWGPYNHPGHQCCVPFSSAFLIATGLLSFWIPIALLFIVYPVSLYLLMRRRKNTSERTTRSKLRASGLDGNQAMTHASSPRQSAKPLNLQNFSPQPSKEPLVRKLSRRLSSRRRKEESQMTGPSSPKLDRHPSLRYSIKRNASGSNGSHRRRSDRQRRRQQDVGETGTPLLTTASEIGASSDSVSHSATDVDRSMSELDDQTICQILLADAAMSSKQSSVKHGRGSSAKRRKKGSLSATPPSPTLDRHPSLRYSTKRRRGERSKQGSVSRSPSIRSHHSCISQTPSQRSGLSRTPSQRSARRSPNTALTPSPGIYAAYQAGNDASSANDLSQRNHSSIFVFPDIDKPEKCHKTSHDLERSRSNANHANRNVSEINATKGHTGDMGTEQHTANQSGDELKSNGQLLAATADKKDINVADVNAEDNPHRASGRSASGDEAEVEEQSGKLLTVDHLSPSQAAHKKNSPNKSHTMDSLLLPNEHDGMMAIPHAQSIESLSDQEAERSRRRRSLRRRAAMDIVTSLKLTFMLGLMSVSFIVLHLPYFVTSLAWAVSERPSDESLSAAVFITEWLAYATSLSNPLLVLAFHKDLLISIPRCTSS